MRFRTQARSRRVTYQLAGPWASWFVFLRRTPGAHEAVVR